MKSKEDVGSDEPWPNEDGPNDWTGEWPSEEQLMAFGKATAAISADPPITSLAIALRPKERVEIRMLPQS